MKFKVVYAGGATETVETNEAETIEQFANIKFGIPLELIQEHGTEISIFTDEENAEVEKAEAERLAAEKAEAERLAAEKAESDAAEAARLAATEKANAAAAADASSPKQ